jgi:hypothetical protein
LPERSLRTRLAAPDTPQAVEMPAAH